MSKKGQLPELLFISPIGHREKIRHKHVVFRVEACDANGVPRILTLLGDNETVSIANGERFITAYVQGAILHPNPDSVDYRAS